MDIKTVARRKGMTLEQIAIELGITKGAVSKALNGNPTLKTLRAIAEKLDVPITAFFADEIACDHSSGQVCPHCGKPITVKIE